MFKVSKEGSDIENKLCHGLRWFPLASSAENRGEGTIGRSAAGL
jgi:hypothetical protein